MHFLIIFYGIFILWYSLICLSIVLYASGRILYMVNYSTIRCVTYKSVILYRNELHKIIAHFPTAVVNNKNKQYDEINYVNIGLYSAFLL